MGAERMCGGGVSGLQNEEDVLAMHAISGGQEETAVRTSSGTTHYGPRGGGGTVAEKGLEG